MPITIDVKHKNYCCRKMSGCRIKFGIYLLLVYLSSCAYFNTFYNAQNYFRQAKKLVKNDTLKVDSEYFDKTIEKATAVIVRYPNCRWIDDALFMMGASYYYKGDYSRALEKLNFLTTNYQNSGFYDDALYYIGLSHYKLQKYSAAVVVLKEAMESKKFKKKAMILLLSVYYKDKNYTSLNEIAYRLLDESLNYQERRAVLYLLGEGQFGDDLYVDALGTFKQLLSVTRTDEDKRRIKLRIAQVYLEMGEYELCNDFLKGESDPEFKNLSADLNIKLGDFDAAKRIYVDVATSSVGDFAAQAYHKLAEIYENEDSLDLAIAYYDSSVIRSSSSEYGIKAKQKSDVLKRIQILMNETEHVDRAQFLLAEALFADLKDTDKAIEEYKKVYINHPRSDWAPKALYAHFWIVKNFYSDDTLAENLARDLIDQFPSSEYASSAKKILEGHVGEMNEKE